MLYKIEEDKILTILCVELRSKKLELSRKRYKHGKRKDQPIDIVDSIQDWGNFKTQILQRLYKLGSTTNDPF